VDSTAALDFLNSVLASQAPELIAGSPSFEITGPGGDARRSRKGLTPQDVDRLIEANPAFREKIEEMYKPGPQLPRFGPA
jgi:hypothetical protein